MGYVYYQKSYSVQQAKRSPLGRFAAWSIDKASGTWLEGWAKFFLGESLVGRFASVIVVSLILGAIIDLTIVSVPVLSSPTSAIGAAVTTPAVLGALAGAGAGGLGGAIVGGIWGWLIGEVSEAIVTEAVSDQVARTLSPILTWIVATLSGLLAGKIVVWGYEKVASKSSRLGRFIAIVFLLVALSAIGTVVYGIVGLIVKR